MTEQTYHFDGNEVSFDFYLDVNYKGYNIKHVKITTNKQINKENDAFIIVFDGNDIKIIKETREFYNNVIEYTCNPFISYNNKLIYIDSNYDENDDIDFLKICLFDQNTDDEIEIISMDFTIFKNDIYYKTLTLKNSKINQNKIYSNYIKTIDELKELFLNNSPKLTEKIFYDWLDKFGDLEFINRNYKREQIYCFDKKIYTRTY